MPALPGPPFTPKAGSLLNEVKKSYLRNTEAVVSASVEKHQQNAGHLPTWKRLLGEKVIDTFSLDMDRIRSGAIAGTLYYEMAKQQGLFVADPKGKLTEQQVQASMPTTAKFYYNDLQLPTTFSQWFQITSLHVWMLFVRMRAMPKAIGREYQQKLVDTVFSDMEKRLAYEMRIRSGSIIERYKKDFNLQLRGSVMSYDEGFYLDDATLASALWRNLFAGREDIDPTYLEQLVHYIRTQLYVMENISDFDFSRGRFFFINPALRYEPLSNADIAEIKEVAKLARTDAAIVNPSDKTTLSTEGW
ncbi:hypothetical protein DV495_003813 [Geotrichum candidum]|nr:hypothetical protein DV454_002267 [Geotrichum candidum]KAI9211015.1 hypothetical protein DS838_004092 [Geotrichum bryndzae]KAF5116527.1 hypothetical protein DV452_002622 [Geotrichum candidum]KAF5124750.1 hypothetical protein DV495_003813 [Geotrichum candidum]KAF7498016.1 hypothetical protein DV113_003951 [Geotrichum candidum]